MSKAYNSPTARLLQSSRLFSLPRPLPPAALETPSSTGSYRASETATPFYPTHQAITTPSSSHFRGDWGLKRAIPGKTTKSSTPSIRVLGQDTPDHITDFESAADHERSRQKFAEMGVPITTRGKDEKSRRSVYEDFLDSTDPDAALTSGPRSGNDASNIVKPQRWRHQGPWIAGMQEGEFQQYIEKQLASRQEEWTEHLMKHFANERFERERSAAREGGRYFGPVELAAPSVQAEAIVERAERESRQLYQSAVESGDAAGEKTAKEEGERIVAQAREQAVLLEREMQGWEAPEQARRVMAEAERLAATERRRLAEEGDVTGEAASEVEYILSNAVREAARLLNAAEATTHQDVYALIRETDAKLDQAHQIRASAQKVWEAERRHSLRPSLPQLAELQKDLREAFKDGPLGSKLAELIVSFLDMPAIFDPNEVKRITGSYSDGFTDRLLAQTGAGSTDSAPPTTHPGAGLSYLRTNAVMENHPTQGPQAHRSAIVARVLQARAGSRGVRERALLGAGGFVAQDSVNQSGRLSSSKRGDDDDPARQLDDITEGGGKVFIHPLSATVDEAGRVQLKLVRAEKEAVAVKAGKIDEEEDARRMGSQMKPFGAIMPADTPEQHARPDFRSGGNFGMSGGRSSASGPQQRRARYGTAMPDMRRLAADEARYGTGQPAQTQQPRQSVRGFDNGVVGRRREGSETYDEIARLAGFSRERPSRRD